MHRKKNSVPQHKTQKDVTYKDIKHLLNEKQISYLKRYGLTHIITDEEALVNYALQRINSRTMRELEEMVAADKEALMKIGFKV